MTLPNSKTGVAPVTPVDKERQVAVAKYQQAKASKEQQDAVAKYQQAKPAPKPAPATTRPIPGQPGYAGTTGGPKPIQAIPPNQINQTPIRSDRLPGGEIPGVPTTGGPLPTPMKKGGRIKSKTKSSYSSGGKVSSASKRGDGCAQRGKTKGRMV